MRSMRSKHTGSLLPSNFLHPTGRNRAHYMGAHTRTTTQWEVGRGWGGCQGYLSFNSPLLTAHGGLPRIKRPLPALGLEAHYQ